MGGPEGPLLLARRPAPQPPIGRAANLPQQRDLARRWITGWRGYDDDPVACLEGGRSDVAVAELNKVLPFGDIHFAGVRPKVECDVRIGEMNRFDRPLD